MVDRLGKLGKYIKNQGSDLPAVDGLNIIIWQTTFFVLSNIYYLSIDYEQFIKIFQTRHRIHNQSSKANYTYILVVTIIY